MFDKQTKRHEKQWNIGYQASQESELAIRRMALETNLSEITARLLYLRGYQNAEAAMRFLRLEETALHDPFLMKDIPQAVERIELALERKEKIAIYGDYDVDGVTSVSMIYLYLKSLGGEVGYKRAWS